MKNKFLKNFFKWSISIILLATIAQMIRGYLFINNDLQLMSWHKESKYEEPQYKDFSKLEDYLKAEKDFLNNTYAEVETTGTGIFNRYIRGTQSDPFLNGENLNSSYEIIPENIKGGVLLLHGLTDSPYMTRDLAKIYADNGYYVLALRYQHHGTHPGELLKLDWKNFMETAKFGSKMVRDKISKISNSKFFIAGYSTGAAVSLEYVTNEIIKDSTLPKPDKLFWFSPAMGVSPLAKVAFLDLWLAKIKYFHKFNWLDIEPEFDGGKYNSFPKNAGVQVDNVIMASRKSIEQLSSQERAALPPIYAYTSLEDGTVDETKLYKVLGDIGNENGELVIFDANRKFNEFFNKKIRDLEYASVLKENKIKYRLLVLTNYDNQLSDKVKVYETKDGITKVVTTTEELVWDPFTFSLAHLSIPLSPSNHHYGKQAILGNINMKGEKDILAINSENLMRLRYNQFFSFMEENLSKNINE